MGIVTGVVIYVGFLYYFTGTKFTKVNMGSVTLLAIAIVLSYVNIAVTTVRKQYNN